MQMPLVSKASVPKISTKRSGDELPATTAGVVVVLRMFGENDVVEGVGLGLGTVVMIGGVVVGPVGEGVGGSNGVVVGGVGEGGNHVWVVSTPRVVVGTIGTSGVVVGPIGT